MWFGKKNALLPTGVITTSQGLECKVSHLKQLLGSMAGQYIVLLSAHIKAAG